MKKIIITSAFAMLLFGGFAANGVAATSYSTSVVTATASSDWDKLLDDYEKYVDLYIKSYKKAMAGDMSAMMEYSKMMEKAQSISDKLDKVSGDLSAAQMKRYLKITQKMTDAL